MLDNSSAQYKKSWLINSTIARELACFSPGDRLPTIQELTERLNSSRGIVQKALNDLQDKKSIKLEKRGKMGTFIKSLDQEILFEEGGLSFITGTMHTPVNIDLVSLASGICEAMDTCPVSFGFAFIQSTKRRALALSRSFVDFSVSSVKTAEILCTKHSDLTLMATLDDCIYSPPFVLCSNKGRRSKISAGDRIAADPGTVDHFHLTKELCKGIKVRLIERPYLTCRAMFLAGDVDFFVYRYDKFGSDPPFYKIPIENGDDPAYLIPAITINKNNYNIDNILKPYLCSVAIREGQLAVMENRREPVVF